MNGIWMFSTVLWVFLDRAKKIWVQASWGNWLTIGLATVVGLILAFGYRLDLLMVVGLTEQLTVGGQIFAGLAVAAGSSCIHELLEKVQDKEA
ncbi:MAG: hypothetical protein DBY39_03140 [Clostridiales bacterium]|mgnify:FL=1|nr:MAG: hypothetical protein DBY39_03140 [Clostridiales bacterium]